MQIIKQFISSKTKDKKNASAFVIYNTYKKKKNKIR